MDYLSEKEKYWHTVARLEKAIKEKYGDLAVANYKQFWNEEKQGKYLEELKEYWQKKHSYKIKNVEQVEKNGYLVRKKLFNDSREQQRQCSVCDKYSFDIKDGYYFIKFDCCFHCYIQWIEDREERWNSGWRPNTEDSK